MTPRTFTLAQARRLLPARPQTSHKGDFGHVLIVAGSRGMGGAAALTALGALRSGAGLVTVAVPASQQRLVAEIAPEALTLALPESAGRIGPAAVPALRGVLLQRPITAVAIGPGIATAPAVAAALTLLIPACASLPLVLDADALNCLAAMQGRYAESLLKGRSVPAVLTPHPGEAARLLATASAKIQADRAAAAARLAARFRSVCLLKGHRTVVTDGKTASLNPTGNPGMAKGGMGDVLTGLIGGFLAQGLAPLDAARLGAFAHGLAGDLAAGETGQAALLARDLAAALPAALKRIEGGRR